MINLFDTCNVCQKLKPAPEQKGTKFHVLGISELEKSAQLGTCFLCSLLFTAISDYGYISPNDNQIFVRTGHDEPFFLMWIDAQLPVVPHLEIFRQTGSTSIIEGLGWANAVPREPNNQATNDLIIDWVRDCEENHAECRVDVQETPKRLLDLECSGPEGICLVQDLKPSKYVALSHCWGNVRACTTTSGNLTSRLSGIKWDDLAKTFQDAVTLTRQIGFRHLWIDSLCIIQDDSDDWKKESVKMGDIYRGAYLTIAASLASADDEGFLHPSKERDFYSAKCLRVPFQGGVITDLWVRTIHDSRLHSFHNISEPLSTRAWTMQERVLAPRLLSYSSAVTFECTASAVCECGHSMYPDPYYPPVHMLQGLDNKQGFLSILQGEPQSIARMYSFWSDMVSVYTGRKLTFETDRQIAISAIARALAKQYGDEYIAGLWKGNLVPGLTWHNDIRLPVIKNVAAGSGVQLPNRPPSWSWLSAEKLVSTYRLLPGHCEVISTDVQEGGLNDSGPARGCIKLRAQTGTMVAHLPEKGQLDSETSGATRFALLGPNDNPVEVFKIEDFRVDRPVARNSALNVSADMQGGSWVPMDRTFPIRVLCLHLGTTIIDDNNRESEVFLALGHLQGRYSRIGLVRATITRDALREWVGESRREITIY
ncbi:heterokaryon incompatibility protein-domain-containing protein [Emericellopsis atlantica]|uniref:Heterokaryon incompatibility protein-domain-containing protein n=1 Tax=Emericellopsis atlantica TaxID=2614577 RepID=A0A9P7ZEZ7_9HYPO|nr:heterokaryon incompatibility protein-domain-containing protein [Emericellopsis atlantica]KAG9250597.1 heterokaryon incompatibility protein-domain-containing protein [Emericellopsis atlantica]